MAILLTNNTLQDSCSASDSVINAAEESHRSYTQGILDPNAVIFNYRKHKHQTAKQLVGITDQNTEEV